MIASTPACLLVGLCVVPWLVMGGCARLVTVDPQDVASYNSKTWHVRQATPPTAPDAATATEGDAAVVTPLPAATAASLPFRKRPQVIEALRSRPDELGIPSQLYQVDPLLTAHRRELDSQASGRRQAGAANIIIGVIGGGLSAWAVSVGASHQNDPNPSTRDSAGQALVYGTMGAVLSLAQIVVGIVVVASSRSDPAPLMNYYRETYAPGR